MKHMRAKMVLMAAALISAMPSLAMDEMKDTAMKMPSAPKMSEAKKIKLAMSAGPEVIAKNATIMDMTDMSAPPKQIRAGTNGWVCYALVDMPMCLDKAWQKWLEAWMSKGALNIEGMGTGIAYMLAGDHGSGWLIDRTFGITAISLQEEFGPFPTAQFANWSYISSQLNLLLSRHPRQPFRRLIWDPAP